MRGMSSSWCECGHGSVAVENLIRWPAVLLADHLQCGHGEFAVENEKPNNLRQPLDTRTTVVMIHVSLLIS